MSTMLYRLVALLQTAQQRAWEVIKMPDQWEFMSHSYDNCNCSVSCGCQFNQPTTHGNCQFAYVGNIVKGHFNGTPLVGLNWSMLCKFPGEIAEGNGQRLIVIDERANDAQRKALETIISGEACKPLSNHFAVFGSWCTEFFETLFLSPGSGLSPSTPGRCGVWSSGGIRDVFHPAWTGVWHSAILLIKYRTT